MGKLSNTLERYADIQRAMENFRLTGGGFLLFESHGSAVHWRHRAYRWRNLFAAHQSQIYEGIDHEKTYKTPFDDMLLRVEHLDEPIKSGDKVFRAKVEVEFRLLETPPMFDHEGKPITIRDQAVEVDNGAILPIDLEVKGG